MLQTASTVGLESITFGGIAGALGLSKGNLTVLFGDKTSLQLAAFDAAILKVVDVIVKPALAKRTPKARLRALVDGWFGNIENGLFPGGCFLFGTAHEFRARGGPVREQMLLQMRRWHGLFEREFEAAGARNPAEAAFSVLSYQNSAHLFLQLGDTASFERAHRGARRVVESLGGTS